MSAQTKHGQWHPTGLSRVPPKCFHIVRPLCVPSSNSLDATFWTCWKLYPGRARAFLHLRSLGPPPMHDPKLLHLVSQGDYIGWWYGGLTKQTNPTPKHRNEKVVLSTNDLWQSFVHALVWTNLYRMQVVSKEIYNLTKENPSVSLFI